MIYLSKQTNLKHEKHTKINNTTCIENILWNFLFIFFFRSFFLFNESLINFKMWVKNKSKKTAMEILYSYTDKYVMYSAKHLMNLPKIPYIQCIKMLKDIFFQFYLIVILCSILFSVPITFYMNKISIEHKIFPLWIFDIQKSLQDLCFHAR